MILQMFGIWVSRWTEQLPKTWKDRSHQAWGKAWVTPRVGTVRNWTPSVWQETAHPHPISVLSPTTVTTKPSWQADSEPFVRKAQESLPLLQQRAWLGHYQTWGRNPWTWPLTKRPAGTLEPLTLRTTFAFFIRTKQNKSIVPNPKALFWGI